MLEGKATDNAFEGKGARTVELDKLLKLVKPEWHKAFLRFIDTGEADEAFMKYMNGDPQAQGAVEMAFDAQAKAFEGLATELSSQRVSTAQTPTAVSGDLARVVRDVLTLDPQVRREVLQEAVCALEASISPKQKKELEDVAEQVGKALSTAAAS
jgi:predicted NBD/HSP70 family sugar kinase